MTHSTTHVPTRLLGVWAHPDDEAYLAAGLMARAVDSGGVVTLVVVTDGELGFPDEDPRALTARAAQRREELTAAMDVIGVHDVRFLGLPDGGVSTASPQVLRRRIAAVMREFRPEVVTTFGPDGITGHPDHIATGAAVTSAWLDVGHGELWYAAKTTTWLDQWREQHNRLGVWMTDEPIGYEDADLSAVVTLDESELVRKRTVLLRHKSQTGGVAAAFGERDYREWVRQESFRQPTEIELFDIDPARSMANWCHPRRPRTLQDALDGGGEVLLAPDRSTSFRPATLVGVSGGTGRRSS